MDLNHDELLEKLAEIAHTSWTGWTEWMMEKWAETHASGETFRTRWLRQCLTEYKDLSEAEKESDRIEARKYLQAIEEHYSKTIHDYLEFVVTHDSAD